MATESCPRCGEKAINQTGHCVFCGAVVIAPTVAPSSKNYEKALSAYQKISCAFLIVGIIYIAFGVIGSVMLKKALFGLLSVGILTFAHGTLLIKNNDWVRSVTKVVCGVRLGILILIFLVFCQYSAIYGPIVFAFTTIFVVDMICLVLMIRCIDEVYFA